MDERACGVGGQNAGGLRPCAVAVARTGFDAALHARVAAAEREVEARLGNAAVRAPLVLSARARRAARLVPMLVVARVRLMIMLRVDVEEAAQHEAAPKNEQDAEH